MIINNKKFQKCNFVSFDKKISGSAIKSLLRSKFNILLKLIFLRKD